MTTRTHTFAPVSEIEASAKTVTPSVYASRNVLGMEQACPTCATINSKNAAIKLLRTVNIVALSFLISNSRSPDPSNNHVRLDVEFNIGCQFLSAFGA